MSNSVKPHCFVIICHVDQKLNLLTVTVWSEFSYQTTFKWELLIIEDWKKKTHAESDSQERSPIFLNQHYWNVYTFWGNFFWKLEIH